MCRPGASSTMDTGCSAIGVFFSCSSLLPTPSDRCAELWQAEMDEDGEEMMRMTMMINSATPIDGTTCPVDVRVDKGHCSPARPSDSARDPHGILVEKFSPHDHERQPGTAEKDDDDNDNHDDYTGATTRHSADMVMCSPDPHFQSNLGAILRGESSRPHDIPLQLLKEITDSFSDKRILGKGGVGVVYKGVLPNGEMIAVKRIVSPFMPGPQKQFESEVCHLMLLKHPNIVPFVGYCYERKNECVKHDGKYVLAELVEMLLCFEYLPNGSLDEYLSDESSGLDWSTRYKIIEGICYGLCHLHEQVGKPIIHLDLKPANILLDDSMVPKITDFGLSRLLDQQQTICTSTRLGTFGYMPPEFLHRGTVTPKFDIFSLGVIIMEVVTGHRDYPDVSRTPLDEFIKLVLEKWRNVLHRSLGHGSLDTYCEQIKRCIQTSLICVNPERTKRPPIMKIINMLQGSESIEL